MVKAWIREATIGEPASPILVAVRSPPNTERRHGSLLIAPRLPCSLLPAPCSPSPRLPCSPSPLLPVSLFP
jgi:hypothetical protein